LFFALASLFPLVIAILLLLVKRDWTESALGSARNWLVRHARVVAAVLIAALAFVLMRNGIKGLTS
jgi:hypothetical protein